MSRTKNPLRFGVNIGGRPFPEALSLARAAEEAGFDTVAFTDRPPENNLEAWTLATAIGVMTRRVILTHSTLNVPFRNPALLAKMAASLDAVTGGGRVELTLGAGGQEPHYRSYGIHFGTDGERVTDLIDAVAIMRGLWANESFSYKGARLSVENAAVTPTPASGSIPIWIGALGPRMMRFTGAQAEGWMKNRGWPESTAQLTELIGLLEGAAQKAGRDPATIRRVLNGAAVLGSGPQPVARGLVGTSQQIMETVHQYREMGIDTFHLRFPDTGTEEHVRRFAEEVIIPLR
ncbi:MAG: LLM class flavin-dependent oxidoreductase [Chloroflexi bacterium]|nr:LLM class flavin-dependent oxidoreductase [Chloroflexota bacterium]